MLTAKPSFAITLTLVIISLLAVASTEDPAGSKSGQFKIPKIFDFGDYVEKFKKSYNPLETIAKAQLFISRTLKIFQHNAQFAAKKVGYFLAQNAFTDMSAEEIQRRYTGGQEDLAPVAEASLNPDLPADQSVSVQKMNAELGNDESFSRSTASDLESNAKFDKTTRRVKPIVNFLHDEKVNNLKLVFEQLREIPGDVRDEMENMVEMSDARWDDSKRVEIARLKNKIKTTPVIKSDNAHYDPPTAPSFGLLDDKKERQTNYAKYLMDDLSFGFNIEPYPVPKAFHEQEKTSEKSKHQPEEPKSFLSSFINSVAAVGDLFYPDEEEEEVEHDKEAERILSQAKVELQKGKEVNIDATSKIPKYNIDWRKTGCISQMQNQQSCNSCYAFTVLALMEYLYCRQTRELTAFSAQYIVDCGHMSQLNGCRGGKISNVGHFIRNYGLELNTNYPYIGKENQCPYSDEDANGIQLEKATGYMRPEITRWQMFQDMAAWFKWLRKSPLIVGINMPSDFLAYGGGIHDGLDCVPEMTHAMLLVGSGIQDGKEFWLLKNSYSDSWGESGFFKLSKSAPLRCFNSAIVARASFNANNKF